MIEICVGPRSGNHNPSRAVALTGPYGDVFRDKIDVDSAYQREQLIARASEQMEISRDELAVLSGRLCDAADAADKTETTTSEPPAFVKMLSGADLLALDLRPNFLVRGVLVQGQPCIVGGRSKVLKTSLAIDLALSLGTGKPFLGKFHSEKVGVGFWSGESGATTVRETAKRIADAKGVDLADAAVSWCFDLPRLSRAEDLDHVENLIRGEGLQVAIFDPLYLCLHSAETAGGASNVYAMGALLQGLTRLGQQTGCCVVLLHHFRKTGQTNDDEPPNLEELSQAGVAEWARQWVLLKRRTTYQDDGKHSLWLRAGGSAGHASLWGVSIDEGLLDVETYTGRRWEVSVAPAADARQEVQVNRENRKAAEQERREGEHRDRLLTTLHQCPEGETFHILCEAAGLNSKAFGPAITTLLQEGRAAKCEVIKTRGKYDGYRPTDK